MILSILAKVCCIYIFTFPLARSRKYDLEAESLRIYGEEFSALLRKFRRTPEYLRILEDKRKEMDIRFKEVSVQVLQKQEAVLMQRVADKVGHTLQPTTTDGSTTTLPTKLRHFNYKARRSNEDDDNDDDEETTTKDPVSLLDGYHLLHRALTTHDRNEFRDLGFEMAGQAVHLIIKGMGPVTNPQPSNNMIEPKLYVTEVTKPHDHEVVHLSTQYQTIVEDSVTFVVDAYKFKRKNPNTFPRV